MPSFDMTKFSTWSNERRLLDIWNNNTGQLCWNNKSTDWSCRWSGGKMAENDDEELVINLVCQYNSTRRTTPLYFEDCVLDNLEYHEFIEQLLFEISQLRMFGKLRLALVDNGNDIDLLPSRYRWQVKDALKRTERLTKKVIESSTSSPLPVNKRLKTEDKPHPDSSLRFSQPPGHQLLFSNVSQCSFPKSNHKPGETAESQHFYNQAKQTSPLDEFWRKKNMKCSICNLRYRKLKLNMNFFRKNMERSCTLIMVEKLADIATIDPKMLTNNVTTAQIAEV